MVAPFPRPRDAWVTLAAGGLACGVFTGLVLGGVALGVTDHLDSRVAGWLWRNRTSEQLAAANEVVQISSRDALALSATLVLVGALLAPPARVLGAVVALGATNGVALLIAPAFVRTLPVGKYGDVVSVAGGAPSNHTALIASLSVAAAILGGPRWRPATVMVGVAATGVMAFAVVVRDSHVLSDVVSAAGLAAAVAFAAFGVERALVGVLPARLGPLPLRRGGAMVTLVVTGAAAALLSRSRHQGVAFEDDVTGLAVPGALALALGVAAAVGSLAARRRSAG